MPTNKDIAVTLKLKDELSKRLKGVRGHFHRFSNAIKKHWKGIAIATAAAMYAFKKFVDVARAGFRSLIQVASQMEQLRIRLKVLLGSVKEGNKVFKDMTELASQVPKTYDEIMESATALAAVVRDGSEEVKKYMPLIVDLSAATGISVQDVTSQMIRMYSAGAASADMFRERGVLAMLGFQAGVSYSAEETMKQVVASWKSATSKFRGASEELAKSFDGLMSMMQDAWFQFRGVVGEKLFEQVKLDLQTVLKLIEEMKESGQYEELAIGIANIFESLYEGMKNSIGLLVETIIYFRKVSLGLQYFWQDYNKRAYENTAQIRELTDIEKQRYEYAREKNKLLEEEALKLDEIEQGWEKIKVQFSGIREEIMKTSEEIDASSLRDPFAMPDFEAIKAEQFAEAHEQMEGDLKKFYELRTLLENEDRMRFETSMQGKIDFLNTYKELWIKGYADMWAFASISIQSFHKGMSKALSDMILGVKSARQAFKEFGKAMVQSIVDYLAQQAVAYVISTVLRSTLQVGLNAMAAQLAAAWAPAAAMASLASFGGNAAPAMAGMSATTAAAYALAAPKPMAFGGDKVVTKPTLFLAGEVGPERATFTPLDSSGDIEGANITINIYDPQMNSREDVGELAEELGFKIDEELRYARGI